MENENTLSFLAQRQTFGQLVKRQMKSFFLKPKAMFSPFKCSSKEKIEKTSYHNYGYLLMRYDNSIIFYMWNNNSSSRICNFFPFAAYQHTNYVPPYPIPQLLAEECTEKIEIKKAQINAETVSIETFQNNAAVPERDQRFRKAKKKAKRRMIMRKKIQETYEKKEQKRNRNLPSNICRFFVLHIYRHPDPQLLLGPNKPQIAGHIRSFISQLKKYVKESQTYFRPCVIEAMCRGKLLKRQQSQICRILFKRFVKLELKIMISTMKRLKKKQKISYFKVANKFLRQFTRAN